MRRTAALALAAALLAGCSSGPDEGSGTMAEIMCERFVKERLKAPATADFADTSNESTGTQQWLVTGAVDSENSFGAKIRTQYECEVKYQGEDRWTLVRMGGELG